MLKKQTNKKVFPFRVGGRLLAEVQRYARGTRADQVVKAAKQFKQKKAVPMFREKNKTQLTIQFTRTQWNAVEETARFLNCNPTDIVRGAFIPKKVDK